MRRALGAVSIPLFLVCEQSAGADVRGVVEAYVARVAGTALEDLTVDQTFTLYHPNGRHPAVTGRSGSSSSCPVSSVSSRRSRASGRSG